MSNGWTECPSPEETLQWRSMLSKSSAATSQGLIQKEKVHIEYKQGDQQGCNTMKTQ